MNAFVDFLKEKGGSAQKSLSQNFLVNQTVIKKFIDAGQFNSGEKVVEIGPGSGALSLPLLEKGVDLTAIEISPLLVEWLKLTYGNRFRLLQEDALQVDFNKLFPNGERVSLVSNLPFKITSSLFEHLFCFASLFTQYLVIVQKEVGELILASPGDKNYGILSILVQRYTEQKKLFLIPKGNFAPVPSVDSMALLLKSRERIEQDASTFVIFLKKIFSLRRKTLEHSFKILNFPQISEKRRAEALSADELYALFIKAS